MFVEIVLVLLDHSSVQYYITATAEELKAAAGCRSFKCGFLAPPAGGIKI